MRKPSLLSATAQKHLPGQLALIKSAAHSAIMIVGALLAKITLPGDAQKNSGSKPFFINTRDPQATEAAVLKAVRRWRTDNLEARDIHDQDASGRQDEQDDMLGYWFTQYIADATLTRVAHDAREKGKTWTAWEVVPLLDHEPESPRERSAVSRTKRRSVAIPGRPSGCGSTAKPRRKSCCSV